MKRVSFGSTLFFIVILAVFLAACGTKTDDRVNQEVTVTPTVQVPVMGTTPTPQAAERLESLCVPEQKEDVDFRVLNTDSRPALEQYSVAWKMLNLGEDEELIARSASTAFLNALNVPLSNIPGWFIEMLDKAISDALAESRPVDYGFFNDALERFATDPRYSRFKDPEQKFKLFKAVNEGFIKAIEDPFAAYVTPRQVELGALSYTGTFYGIGGGIGRNENNEWELPHVMEGGPAEKAGLKAHDILRRVDGKSVVGCTSAEIILNIRGKKGTKVTLLIERDGEEIEFVVTRDEIKVENVQSWPLFEWPDGRGSSGKTLKYNFPLKTRDGKEVPSVAYIQFGSFDLQPTKDLYYVLSQMPWEEISGLIMDLRGNPGGLLSSGIAATGYFLPPDAILLYEREADGRPTVHRNSGGEDRESGLYFVPNLVPEYISVVILLDKNSASASELFAGALQDHGRAVLVGERTAGKGTVNQHFLLRRGEYGDLYIAIRLWETPKNRFIEPLHKTEEGGLLPDVVVEQSIRPDPENDENIFAALEVLLGKDE